MTSPDPKAAPAAAPARRDHTRWAAVEVALAIALVLADYLEIVPWSSTPFFLALGWISLRRRGLGWRDVGLVRPASWPRTLLLGGLAGVALEAFSTWVSVPLLSRLAGQPPDLSDFQPLVGNLGLVLALLLPLWLGSALEELVYRGYLMSRCADLAGRGPAAWAFALVFVSALFGWGHGGQGLTGMVQEGLAGAALGGLYLASGRRLGIPIVAHAASNTFAFALIYLGRYPGV